MNTNKTTPTLYTMPSPAALSAEAKAEGTGESVVLALCEVCGQPTADSVIKQYDQVCAAWRNQCIERGNYIKILEAKIDGMETKAILMSEHPDHGGDEDRFWGFAILLLAIVVSFALGWVMSSAVGV